MITNQLLDNFINNLELQNSILIAYNVQVQLVVPIDNVTKQISKIHKKSGGPVGSKDIVQ